MASKEQTPRVEVFLAGREDDAGIRALVRGIPAGRGWQLALHHEPSYFDSIEVQGSDPVVVAAATAGTPREIVFVGTASVKRAFLSGSPELRPVGYLGGMRMDPRFRGSTLFFRAHRVLREECLARPARLFLTTILDDNVLARTLLEAARAGLPRYEPFGILHTLTYAPRGDPWRRAGRAVEVRRATPDVVPAVVAFWRAEGPRRQFFPAYGVEDLAGAGGLLRGLAVSDMHVARDGDRIVGTLAAWDQRAFRQWVALGYPRGLSLVRPVVDAAARATGRPRLPPLGGTIDLRVAALLCVAGDRGDVFRALLSAVWRDLGARSRGCLLALGLHDRDPLLDAARGVPHRTLRSRLYVVHWPEGDAELAALDGRCPYVELGSL